MVTRSIQMKIASADLPDMHQAYSNMLRRSGLAFRAVDADPGAIGGSGSQEFMVLADAGEDEVFYTEDGHAANVEKVSLYHQLQNHLSLQTMKTGTPGCETIETLPIPSVFPTW